MQEPSFGCFLMDLAALFAPEEGPGPQAQFLHALFHALNPLLAAKREALLKEQRRSRPPRSPRLPWAGTAEGTGAGKGVPYCGGIVAMSDDIEEPKTKVCPCPCVSQGEY